MKAPHAVIPQYPDLTPEDRALIELERARIKDLFSRVHVGAAPIDPEVRAEVARREAQAAQLSDRVEPPDLAEMDEEGGHG